MNTPSSREFSEPLIIRALHVIKSGEETVGDFRKTLGLIEKDKEYTLLWHTLQKNEYAASYNGQSGDVCFILPNGLQLLLAHENQKVQHELKILSSKQTAFSKYLLLATFVIALGTTLTAIQSNNIQGLPIFASDYNITKIFRYLIFLGIIILSTYLAFIMIGKILLKK